MARDPRYSAALQTALEVQLLWERLSTVLPALVRIWVPERAAEPLPELRGPKVDGTTHSYEASESRSVATLRLLDAGLPERCVNATILQDRTIVLFLRARGPTAGAVELECTPFRRAQVLEVLRRAVEFAPVSPPPKTAAEHFDEAMKAIALSSSADSYSELRDDLTSALAALEQALALDPRFPRAQYERARVLRRLDRREEAVDAFVEASLLQPEDLGLRLESAVALHAHERWDAALLEYEAVIAGSPEPVPEALMGRARVLGRLERHALALAAWEAVIGLGDTRTLQLEGAGVRLLGEDLRRLEAKSERAWCLTRLGERGPGPWQALLEEHASALTGMSPPRAFLRALGELEGCRLAFERWLAQRPADVPSWKRAVETWSRAERRDEALATARGLVALAPRDSRAWFSLAEVHAARGERAQALAAYERSLSIEPDFLGAKARLDAVKRGAR